MALFIGFTYGPPDLWLIFHEYFVIDILTFLSNFGTFYPLLVFYYLKKMILLERKMFYISTTKASQILDMIGNLRRFFSSGQQDTACVDRHPLNICK